MRALLLALPLTLLLGTAGAVAANLRGCTAEQAEVIRAALDEAEARTRRGLELVIREPDHYLVHRWFGTAPRAQVRSVLERLVGGLEPGRRPPVDCSTGRSCRGGSTFAFAGVVTRRIGVCPRFFDSPATVGRDNRFGVLVHEVSHVVARTIDAAYGPVRTVELARLHPRVAAKNADNVEYFIEGVPEPLVSKGTAPAPAR